MNPLRQLQQYGQSVWLDTIRRDLLTTGGLRRLMEEDGLRGVTSNPTIFAKAVSAGADYDEQIRDVVHHAPDIPTADLYERVTVEDIQMAAGILRAIYDESEGQDGFVSLEVPPPLAHDRDGTIAEVHRLWQLVDRPNLLIKIPGTAEGLVAIEACLSEGININITLMFSLDHYENVANAYLRAMARLDHPARTASVASFFVSRVDTKVDKRLEEIGTPQALALRGKSAVANAKLAYRRFEQLFYGESFAALRQRGARVQRCLWASTSTKNPAYPDTLYVDSLVGPDTVNTMPLETLDAFRDHGHVAPTLKAGVDQAEAQVEGLASLGIDLDQVGDELQREGIDRFQESYDELFASLDGKRKQMLASENTS